MTDSDKTLLERNFKLNLVAVITLITCTATFVWQGGKFANNISNSVDINSIAIEKLEAKVKENREDIKGKANQSEVDNLRKDLSDFSNYVRSR